MKNALEMNYSKHLLVTLPDLWVVHSSQRSGSCKMSVYRSHLDRQHRQTSGESLQNCQWQLTKYPFRDCWQVEPLKWNVPANSKGGLEHAVDVCNICVTDSHHSVEDERNFGLLKTCLFPSTLLNAWFSPLWFLLLLETKLQIQWRYFHYANVLQEQTLTTLHAIQKVSPSSASISRHTQKGNTPKGTTTNNNKRKHTCLHQPMQDTFLHSFYSVISVLQSLKKIGFVRSLHCLNILLK